MSLTRRDVCSLLPMLVAAGTTIPAIGAQDDSMPSTVLAFESIPHRHVHSEMWLIGEGSVELTINGIRHQLGPGGLGFVHSNEEHGIKNVGTGPATHFVVAVGPGADA
jgi:mannose-6-phosphate isomerase-like protein (cupin superfamily)